MLIGQIPLVDVYSYMGALCFCLGFIAGNGR